MKERGHCVQATIFLFKLPLGLDTRENKVCLVDIQR